MYTYEDIKLQNQQDAFSAMYLCIARSVTDLCGRRVGERILREACRRAGRASGLQQRERLRQAGVKTNLHTLYHCGRDFVEDPRVRGQEIFDEEDRQIWEIYTCPLADYWNRRDGGKLGSFYCEEYQYARLLAYTENVGQLNLSKELTCPRDNFCRFSLFFREANMSRERAKEAFAHCDPGGCLLRRGDPGHDHLHLRQYPGDGPGDLRPRGRLRRGGGAEAVDGRGPCGHAGPGGPHPLPAGRRVCGEEFPPAPGRSGSGMERL